VGVRPTRPEKCVRQALEATFSRNLSYRLEPVHVELRSTRQITNLSYTA